MIINQYSDFQVYLIKKVILHEVYMTLHLFKKLINNSGAKHKEKS
jgi:hypothetical protein